ncbi:MAG: fused MFS/spermidine synthase [Steroidobacteraceae bacterium]
MFKRSCALAVLTLLCSGTAHAQMKLVHSERSLVREVLVYDYAGQRCLCFTRECRLGRQSCEWLNGSHEFTMGYARMMLGASLYMNPDPRRILVIGLGAGILPTALVKVLPEAQIDVVEIDPAVTKVARRFFGFKDNERLRVFEEDGRKYVKRAAREGKRYDLIMLDAFEHAYIPEHLLTREFLIEVKSLLAPGAVLAANTFSSSRLYDHESTTYAAVFGQFYNLRHDNRIILVRPDGLPEAAIIAARAVQLHPVLKPYGVEADLPDLFNRKPDWDTKARVLTDQYSPANLLNQ